MPSGLLAVRVENIAEAAPISFELARGCARPSGIHASGTTEHLPLCDEGDIGTAHYCHRCAVTLRNRPAPSSLAPSHHCFHRWALCRYYACFAAPISSAASSSKCCMSSTVVLACSTSGLDCPCVCRRHGAPNLVFGLARSSFDQVNLDARDP
eukprot:5135721-Pyramimonas_sp.AAC.1